jgi:hypothetical protein
MEAHAVVAPSSRWTGFEAASGAVFAVVALIAFLVATGPSDTSTSESIFSYFAANDGRVEWQAALFGVAAVFLFWFAAVLGEAFRTVSDGGRRYAGLLLAGAAGAVALYSGGVASLLALALSDGGADGRTPDGFALTVTRTLWDIGDATFTMSNFAAATFLLAAAAGILVTRTLPAWVAWAAVVAGAYLLVNGVAQALSNSDFVSTMGTIALLVFLAWAFLASIALTIRPGTSAR